MQRSLNRLIRNPQERTSKAAKALGQLFMFLKGTPFIYQGEEIGMINNHRLSINDFDVGFGKCSVYSENPVRPVIEF